MASAIASGESSAIAVMKSPARMASHAARILSAGVADLDTGPYNLDERVSSDLDHVIRIYIDRVVFARLAVDADGTFLDQAARCTHRDVAVLGHDSRQVDAYVDL